LKGGTILDLDALAAALGRGALGRVYCIVLVNGTEDLNELLVANGLARIYAQKLRCPMAGIRRAYITRLTELEGQAKREHKGAWRFVPH